MPQLTGSALKQKKARKAIQFLLSVSPPPFFEAKIRLLSAFKMQHCEDSYHGHDLDDFPEAEFDQQTQARLDAAVDRLLKGYNWTLQPLANK